MPSLGGFNPTFLGLEIRRMLRNRRTVVFALVLPPVFFLLFGTNGDYKTESAGNGNVTAYVMISLAVYGAMLSTTSGGAMVSVERAAGWSRQLRLTPLRPVAYIVVKLIVAMVLGLASVAVVFAVGAAVGATMDGWVWPVALLVAWVGSVVFAAFGLFMGYLLPSENVMQILGPGLAVLALAGGLFTGPQTTGWFATFSKFMPTYGLSQLAHSPLTSDGFTAGVGGQRAGLGRGVQRRRGGAVPSRHPTRLTGDASRRARPAGRDTTSLLDVPPVDVRLGERPFFGRPWLWRLVSLGFLAFLVVAGIQEATSSAPFRTASAASSTRVRADRPAANSRSPATAR